MFNLVLALLAGVVTVAAFGVIGYVMEANGYPVAAMVLGIVMGTMVEQAFVTSLIKSDGSILPFFERPVSAILASMAIGAFVWPVFAGLGLAKLSTAHRKLVRSVTVMLPAAPRRPWPGSSRMTSATN